MIVVVKNNVSNWFNDIQIEKYNVMCVACVSVRHLVI